MTRTPLHRILAGLGALAAGALLGATGADAALLTPGGNVTPDVIFGGGNDNGSFTGVRQNGIELGLRGKLRFDDANLPQNIFNYGGAGRYFFEPGTPPTGFSFDPNSPTTPVWNFEWSINADWDGTSGYKLDDLTYMLGLDFDPGPGTNFREFDPINVPYADHAIGDNTTPNGGGAEATDAADYVNLIALNNVAQNSWSYEFFNEAAWDIFDPNTPGTYTIALAAFLDGTEVASTSIDVVATPVPAALPLFGTGLAALGFLGWRRRRKAAAT